jgi:3-phosphoshikimate 1-carboxyvinyltransferase
VNDEITIEPGRPLTGRIRVPGDKSISHRALLLGALAQGTSWIEGLSTGDDVARTRTAMQAFGAQITDGKDGISVAGGDLHEADAPIDVGNSGTGIRLLAGWCAQHDWLTVLRGDEYIARRPMDRIAAPLRLMGASVDGREGGRYPPLVVRGGHLHGIDYRLPVASAQVKSAVLLAGLSADGPTTVREGSPTRAHTEEMLGDFGADITVSDDGRVATMRRSQLHAAHVRVPGDPSQAAFWIVAGCVVDGSDVTVEDVYVGRARAGFLDVLRRMGADIDVVMRSATTADIRARASELGATTVEGDEVPALIDEIPVLAIAAACAKGVTEFRDAAELMVKETDRVATTVAVLGDLGAAAEPRPDGLVVRGGGPLRGGVIESAGDHRIAMAGAIGALAADEPSRVRGWQAVSTSYPSFLADLERLQHG